MPIADYGSKKSQYSHGKLYMCTFTFRNYLIIPLEIVPYIPNSNSRV